MLNPQDIEQRVNMVLEKVRPYLQADEGDVMFVRYEPEHSTIVVRLLGNCYDCPLALMTLRGGIERHILYHIPEIKRIEADRG